VRKRGEEEAGGSQCYEIGTFLNI